MSITYDRLHMAYFPSEYAEILMKVFAITPRNFLSVKDALHHFRLLDDVQANEAIEQIADCLEAEAEGN